MVCLALKTGGKDVPLPTPLQYTICLPRLRSRSFCLSLSRFPQFSGITTFLYPSLGLKLSVSRIPLKWCCSFEAYSYSICIKKQTATISYLVFYIGLPPLWTGRPVDLSKMFICFIFETKIPKNRLTTYSIKLNRTSAGIFRMNWNTLCNCI